MKVASEPQSALSSPRPNSVPLRHSNERPSTDDSPAVVSGDTARVPRTPRERPRPPTDRWEPPSPVAPNGAVVARMSSTSASSSAALLRCLRRNLLLLLLLPVPPMLPLVRAPLTPPRRCDADGTERTGEPRRRRGFAPAPRSPWIAFTDAVYLSPHKTPACVCVRVSGTDVQQISGLAQAVPL